MADKDTYPALPPLPTAEQRLANWRWKHPPIFLTVALTGDGVTRAMYPAKIFPSEVTGLVYEDGTVVEVHETSWAAIARKIRP